ncbi:flagellar biosynthetic protein FliO, partial [Nitratireductor pacificus]
MRDWLVGIFGEAYAVPAFWTIILVAVAILLWVVLRVSRRLTSGTFVSGGRGRQPRLAVTDATPVDNHRRLVLVRRDNVEHLLLIGGPTDLVVEANIAAPFAAEPRGPADNRPEPALSRPPEANRPPQPPRATRPIAPAPVA